MRELSAAAPADFHPLMTSVPLRLAGEILHVSRSKLYDLLGAGKLRAVKDGKRVMVLIDSIKAYQSSLPLATFAPPSKLGPDHPPVHHFSRRRRRARTRTRSVTE